MISVLVKPAKCNYKRYGMSELYIYISKPYCTTKDSIDVISRRNPRSYRKRAFCELLRGP